MQQHLAYAVETQMMLYERVPVNPVNLLYPGDVGPYAGYTVCKPGLCFFPNARSLRMLKVELCR